MRGPAKRAEITTAKEEEEEKKRERKSSGDIGILLGDWLVHAGSITQHYPVWKGMTPFV